METERATHERFENVRPMVARWVITGTLTLDSATHFGGDGEGFADMKILRDSKDGSPLLPGSSLAGALRSYLADVMCGYCSEEHKYVAELFGTARGDDEGSQSPLIVFDSLSLPDKQNFEIRDGVAINPKTGTAEQHMKYDIEVLPAGTRFPVRLELIVEKSEQEPALVARLVKSLDGLCNGEIALGMRRSRGLGSVKTDCWQAIRFDLTTQSGWLQWLTSDHENPANHFIQRFCFPLDAVRHALSCAECSFQAIEYDLSQIIDKRTRVIIDALLHVEGDLLIRSPGDNSAGADVIHLHSAGNPVLPGTSLSGALRAQALKIAQFVHFSMGDGVKLINNLFGPRIEKKKRDETDSVQPRASKLRISESVLSNKDTRRQTRIAIDRFNGGVVSGALFEEQVHSGGYAKVKIELRIAADAKEETTKVEIGLLLLLLKDLLSGQIPVGGAVSVGRGILKGSAIIRLEDGKEYKIPSDLNVSEAVRNTFDNYIKWFIDLEEVCS